MFYNLDMILSVGYRVNSKKGTQFRIWANNILNAHLVQGYSINESRLKEQNEHLNSLKNTMMLLSNVIENKSLNNDEATGLLSKPSMTSKKNLVAVHYLEMKKMNPSKDLLPRSIKLLEVWICIQA